jgi:hypothetical protein
MTKTIWVVCGFLIVLGSLSGSSRLFAACDGCACHDFTSTVEECTCVDTSNHTYEMCYRKKQSNYIGPRIISTQSTQFKENCQKPCEAKCLDQFQEEGLRFYLQGCEDDCEDKCLQRLNAEACTEFCDEWCQGDQVSHGEGCEADCKTQWCPDAVSTTPMVKEAVPPSRYRHLIDRFFGTTTK